MLDIIIKNGIVYDGSGDPWVRVDIGVEGEKISKMGKLAEKAEKVIDAQGLVVSPGFIDAHSHSDTNMFVNPKMESFIRQGVTTQVCGNCGGSAAPITDMGMTYAKGRARANVPITWHSMAEYMKKVDENGTSMNIVTYVGQATVRTDVMGWELRKASKPEIEEMKKLVGEAMKDGAFGLSTGLYYSPGGFADTQEVIELAKVAAKYGGIYHTHIRGESAMVLDSVKEAITIGQKAKIPVMIAHHKAYGPKYWPLINDTLKTIEDARQSGLEVSYNVYGYTFGSTSLGAMLPYWAHEGGRDKLIARAKDPVTRKRIKRDMKKGVPGWESHVKATGWDTVTIAYYPAKESYEGKTIQQIADNEGRDPYDLALDMLVAGERASILIGGQGEEDRRKVLTSRYSMIGSDGSALAPYGELGKGKNHPRNYGCFPRIFGRYVREWGVLTPEEAIRKMTSYCALKHRIFDRGILRPGAYADIVVFDEKTINDTSTVEEPYTYPTGIKYVIVNGKVTIENGEHTGALAGKMLRHPST